MRIIGRMIAACLGLLFLGIDAPTDQLCGLWLNQEGDAKVEIYQAGSSFEGKIVWLKEPDADGKPKVDKNNPDPTQRDHPVLGLVILHDLHKTGDANTYSGGQIYDPKNGKAYDCRIMFEGDKLNLRGFVLGLPLLGRTAVWTRSE